MNHRKKIEEKILHILLTYKKELISDNSSPGSFELIRKHALLWSDFQDKIHQDVFKAILNQMNKLPAIDETTLVDYRPQEYRAFDGQAQQFFNYIVQLKSTAFATFSELDRLIYKLKEYILADFWQFQGQKILSTSFQSIDVLKFGEDIINSYKSIHDRMVGNIIQSDESSDDMIKDLEKRMIKADSGIYGGIPIHIKSIQEKMIGFNEPDFIVIGARPSMGKTTTGFDIAEEIAYTGTDVAFFSLEMNKTQMVNKRIAKRTGIPFNDIRFGKLTPQQFATVAEWIRWHNNSTLRIFSNIKFLDKIEEKCRSLHKQGKLKIVFIDYLQLVKAAEKYGNRDQEIGAITGRLKSLAIELNIPIIALSQLARKSAGSKPTLTDLRESGNIEQDADVVAFIHRENFYNPNYENLPYEEQCKTEFLIRKSRFGELGDCNYFQDFRKQKTADYI